MVKMVDIETFRKYAKISNEIYNSTEDGISSPDKIRTAIGTEFDIVSKPAIDRHFHQMIDGKFLTTCLAGMKATQINWVVFEEMLNRKAKELGDKK